MLRTTYTGSVDYSIWYTLPAVLQFTPSSLRFIGDQNDVSRLEDAHTDLLVVASFLSPPGFIRSGLNLFVDFLQVSFESTDIGRIAWPVFSHVSLVITRRNRQKKLNRDLWLSEKNEVVGGKSCRFMSATVIGMDKTRNVNSPIRLLFRFKRAKHRQESSVKPFGHPVTLGVIGSRLGLLYPKKSAQLVDDCRFKALALV